MDQATLQQRIQAAKDAGYSDEEIQSALGGNVSVVPSKVPETAQVPVLTAEERTRLQQEEAFETSRREDVTSPEQTTTGLTAAGIGAASALGTGALLLAGKKILSPKVQGASDLANRGVQAAEEANRIAAQSEARIAANQAAKAAQAARPVAPTQILDQFGRPMAPATQPIAPQTMAPQTMAPQATPQAQPQSILDRTTSMIRQLAANKVVQNLAKGSAYAAAALTPGNVGQDYMVPKVGRMRGMEINPMTGRPWTREQLRAYETNPAAFDTALGAAQMPR